MKCTIELINFKEQIDLILDEEFKKIEKDVEETYKEYGTNNTINFDDKTYLFGFNNIVYDLEQGSFREYKYDDYISITCGYDWREPTEEEIKLAYAELTSILGVKDDKKEFINKIYKFLFNEDFDFTCRSCSNTQAMRFRNYMLKK